MSRVISSHRVGELNKELMVLADDEPGHRSKAHHQYRVMGYRNLGVFAHISFQNGTLAEYGGINGITNEALLAIVIDRLRCFQSGEFACRANAIALTKIEEALMWLHSQVEIPSGPVGFGDTK